MQVFQSKVLYRSIFYTKHSQNGSTNNWCWNVVFIMRFLPSTFSVYNFCLISDVYTICNFNYILGASILAYWSRLCKYFIFLFLCCFTQWSNVKWNDILKSCIPYISLKYKQLLRFHVRPDTLTSHEVSRLAQFPW